MVNYLKIKRMGIITKGISNLYDTWVIIVSWNGFFCRGMLIFETNFGRYICEICVKNLGYFTAVNKSAFTFTQYDMISISDIFIRKERRYNVVRHKVLCCLAQIFSKYFAIARFFAQWHHMISQAPIFFPILFAKCSGFVASHIRAIKRFTQIGVHMWYWMSLDVMGAWLSMTSLRSALVYQAISSASSKMFITWKVAHCTSTRKSASLKYL